eukprot:TRINITY_DN8668_c0_g1_i1.p1 TRINITY_DN8668_c0_g1~~TRINITY_DN8668_c0_g1_i1.p1  ORF type:complete len:155 (+),score=9.52 TRINITY_DN8668_c0_g1_i1:181-645(+)
MIRRPYIGQRGNPAGQPLPSPSNGAGIPSATNTSTSSTAGRGLNLEELRSFLPLKTIEWTSADVGKFFKYLGLSVYSKKFENYPITGLIIKELHDEDLLHMKIDNMIHRRMILKAIKHLERYDDSAEVGDLNISARSSQSNFSIPSINFKRYQR